VTFELPNVPGDPKFRGKLSTDGQKIEGTVSQGGADLPCSLERKADPVAAAKEALAGFPAYLSRYAGAYDLIGQTVNVSLKGAALVAVGGGQPPMDLIPTLSGDFTLKQVQVVSIHFIMDDKGNAASFELRQPGTVLTAKRKQ
jgi:hypothetical protein